jgi:hypothetical protein
MLIVTLPVRPMKRPRIRPVIKAEIPFQHAIELTGKAIGLWVMFTSATNWWVYRNIRKENENKK